MERKDVKIFKTADEYTEEELRALPPVPSNKTRADGRSVWLWDGEEWSYMEYD